MIFWYLFGARNLFETRKCLQKDQTKMVDKNEQTADIENQQKLLNQKHAKCSHPPINFNDRNRFKKKRFGIKRAPKRYVFFSFFASIDWNFFKTRNNPKYAQNKCEIKMYNSIYSLGRRWTTLKILHLWIINYDVQCILHLVNVIYNLDTPGKFTFRIGFICDRDNLRWSI